MEFHPVADIFPLLQGEEFEELKSDISTNGLIESIWLHPDGRIVDGRNRWRACTETNTNAHFQTWKGQGSLVRFVISLNIRRRHLDSSQRAAVAVDVLPMLEDEARERYKETVGRPEKSSQKIDTISDHNNGRATQQAAELFYTNRQYVSEAKALKKESPELFEQVKNGNLTIPNAKKEIARQRPPKPVSIGIKGTSSDIAILDGDFLECMVSLKDNSVSLIFTDPPYNKECIPYYEQLAKEAVRVLKPKGSLIAYAGHYALPEILSSMSKHLRYWWMIALKHNGGNKRFPGKWVYIGYKPLVWFVKGGRSNENFVSDLFEGSSQDKSLYEWQQDTSEAAYYIEQLT